MKRFRLTQESKRCGEPGYQYSNEMKKRDEKNNFNFVYLPGFHNFYQFTELSDSKYNKTS